MATRTTFRFGSLALAIALALAACGGGSDKASDTTTPTTTPSSSGSNSGSGSGSTATTAAGGGTTSSTKGPTCKEFQSVVDEAVGTPSASVDDMGGLCTVSLTTGNDTAKIGMLWNYGAASKASWDGMVGMIGEGTKPVDGHGDAAVAGIDSATKAAQAWIWVDGKGAYQLTYNPPFVSNTAATQANVDLLLAIGDKLVAQS